jgi:aspartate aminotransferase-like enzyme/predicted N-acetyltransferase YhbS
MIATTTERSLRFQIASTETEYEQVFRLNYRTFVEEIPQHPPNPERRLVDRFHHQNTYLVAMEGDDLVGMMAVREARPFSLDEKLGTIDSYLPPGRRICELRLLSVLPSHRNGHVFQGLLKLLHEYGRKRRYNLAVISGTLRQQKLYKHLGFVPFGPLVGSAEAQFQPMYLTIEEFEENARPILSSPSDAGRAIPPVFFLPGPVGIHPDVRRAFDALPISHRSEPFKQQLAVTQSLLSQLTGAAHVEILLGSGTLANDVIAAQLSLDPGPGVVISNGEFGTRLMDHARRFQLPFEAMELPWGDVLNSAALNDFLDARPSTRWLWTTACETSTGILNPLRLLKETCAARNIRLCLDAISAIGTVPLDLGGVTFASGVSGKGLAAFPGLSLVFYQQPVQPRPDRLPRYLDLGLYAEEGGVPFTQSSNLLAALQTALRRFDSPRPFVEIVELSNWLRPRLRELGFQILAPDDHAAPAVITLVPPPSVDAMELGNRLLEAGFLASYQSDYLRDRNWLQICLMGECTRASLVALLSELQRLAAPVHPPASAPRLASPLAT